MYLCTAAGSEPAGQNHAAGSETRLPVLEAVGDQLSFGQVVQPGELPAAVSAGVEGSEALVAPLQLQPEPELRPEPLTHKVQTCWFWILPLRAERRCRTAGRARTLSSEPGY